MADDGLPPGFKTLDTVDSGSSDLPPGFKTLDAAEAPAAPSSFWSKLTSNPIPLEDDSYLPEVGKNVATVAKDAGIGAAENITGLGELIPGLSPYAARGSQYLKSNVTYPMAETAGRDLSALAAGGAGAGALKGTKAATQAAEFLFPRAETATAIGRVGQSMAKGGLLTGGAGAASGVLEPTGKEDYDEAMREKSRAAAERGTGGALLGMAAPGVLTGVGEGVKGVKNYLSAGAPREAEALRGLAAGKTGETANEGAAGVVGSHIADSLTTTDLHMRRAELVEMQKTQKGLGLSEHADGMRDRVTNAEHLARQSGLQPDEARTFAVEQEARATEAEHAANQLAQDMDVNTFGERLQKAIDDIHTKYHDVRAKDSGYTEAINRDGENPVGTDSISAYADKSLKKVVDPTTTSFLNYIKNNTADLTLDRTDNLRKYLDKIIRTNRIQFENGNSAVAGDTLHYAREVRSRLLDEMREASPDWGAAFDKFKKLSRPLDMFERGPLAGLAKDDPLSGEYKVLTGDVVGRVLQKTAKGSNAFARLVAENPELKEDALNFFRRELYGPDGMEEEITPERLRTFLKKNEAALSQTGLLNHFKGVKVAAERVEETERALIDIRKAGTLSQDIWDKYDKFSSELKEEGLLSENVAGKARQVASALRKDHFITPEVYDDFLKRATDVESRYKTATERKDRIRHAVALLIYGAGLGTIGFEGYRMLWATPIGHH
jgi:hypothetical protein